MPIKWYLNLFIMMYVFLCLIKPVSDLRTVYDRLVFSVSYILNHYLDDGLSTTCMSFLKKWINISIAKFAVWMATISRLCRRVDWTRVENRYVSFYNMHRNELVFNCWTLQCRSCNETIWFEANHISPTLSTSLER